VLSGLSEIHKLGIIHRDIKPDNLVFANEDLESITVTDFGLSTKFKHGEKLAMRCGTPGYVAPELLNNEGYDEKADLFSLGVVMYEMLTGIVLFRGKSVKEVIWRNTDCKVKFEEP
jgi:serine/threonine protein kinase